ncbi:colicin E5-related ribonuclease [Burkholderia multivorans]|nr:hypothetical protein [Burkholderia multivorans]
MPAGSLTQADAANTLAALQVAQQDPNLTAVERGYFTSATLSVYQAGIQAGVLSARNVGPLVSAAVSSMAFSGGGDGPLPSGGSQSNVLPTTTGSRTAVSLGSAANTGKVIIDSKIGGQLEARGWTQQEVQAIVSGVPVGVTTDNRSAAKTPDGLPRSDSASVYGSKSGYVVVNDRTGEVVQVSGKNDPGWIPDSRIKWK